MRHVPVRGFLWISIGDAECHRRSSKDVLPPSVELSQGRGGLEDLLSIPSEDRDNGVAQADVEIHFVRLSIERGIVTIHLCLLANPGDARCALALTILGGRLLDQRDFDTVSEVCDVDTCLRLTADKILRASQTPVSYGKEMELKLQASLIVLQADRFYTVEIHRFFPVSSHRSLRRERRSRLAPPSSMMEYAVMVRARRRGLSHEPEPLHARAGVPGNIGVVERKGDSATATSRSAWAPASERSNSTWATYSRSSAPPRGPSSCIEPTRRAWSTDQRHGAL